MHVVFFAHKNITFDKIAAILTLTFQTLVSSIDWMCWGSWVRMGQGVRTGLGHGGITCVLQTQFSSCFCFHRKQGLMFHVNPLLSMQRIHMKYKVLLKKIRLDVSCESSVNPHMKYQVLFSLQNNEKVFKTAMLGRGFTWNIKSYFFCETTKKYSRLSC